MLRARVASFVIKAFALAAALGVYAGFTLLLQWTVRSGVAFWPTFLTVFAFFALIVRRKV